MHHQVEAVAAGRRERFPRMPEQAQKALAHIVDPPPLVVVVAEKAAGDVFDDRFEGAFRQLQTPRRPVVPPGEQQEEGQVRRDQERQARDLALHLVRVPEQRGGGHDGKDVPVRDAVQLVVRHEIGFAAPGERPAASEVVRRLAPGRHQGHDVGEAVPERAAFPKEDAPRVVRDHHLPVAVERPGVDGGEERGGPARGGQRGLDPAVHPDGRGVDGDDVVVGPVHRQHFQRRFSPEGFPVIRAAPRLIDEIVGGEGHAFG